MVAFLSSVANASVLFRFFLFFFFFNDTATTEIYTLSLHDALPIFWAGAGEQPTPREQSHRSPFRPEDRKSTRLNSSHSQISYAVFCLKKKKKKKEELCLKIKKKHKYIG